MKKIFLIILLATCIYGQSPDSTVTIRFVNSSTLDSIRVDTVYSTIETLIIPDSVEYPYYVVDTVDVTFTISRSQFANLYYPDMYVATEFATQIIDQMTIEISPCCKPTGITNLSAGAISTSQINISWTDNSDNETGFRIERALYGGSYDSIAVVGIDQTTYQDVGLTASTEYCYRVYAYNGIGDALTTDSDCATTEVAGTVPNAPTNLAGTSGNLQISLTWVDNATDEDSLMLERRLSSGGNFVQVANFTPNTQSYTNTGLANNTSYQFRVRAKNEFGYSDYSNTLTKSTLDTTTYPPGEFYLYVRKGATGLNNGSSWTNAWNEFNQINWSLVNPNDTILISGGTDSLTYRTKMSIPDTETYITIARSVQPGHNGKVIIDGSWQPASVDSEWCVIYNRMVDGQWQYQYITFDGVDQDMFVLQYWGGVVFRCWHQPPRAISFKNMTFHNNPDYGSRMYSASIQYGNSVYGAGVPMSKDLYMENLKIICDSSSNYGKQADGIRIQWVDGVTLKNCWIRVFNPLAVFHVDIIQFTYCKNILIENNQFFQPNVNTTSNKDGVYIEEFGGTFKFINNFINYNAGGNGALFAHNWIDSGGIRDSIGNVDTLIITNNTFTAVGYDGNYPIYLPTTGSNKFRYGYAVLKNNIFLGYDYVNQNHAYPIIDTTYFSRNKSLVDNNIYYRNNGQVISFYTYHSTISWATWQALGYDVHSVNANPQLQGYTTNIYLAQFMKYIPTWTDNIDNGINPASFGYNDDIEGTVRTTPYWIGCYEGDE